MARRTSARPSIASRGRSHTQVVSRPSFAMALTIMNTEIIWKTTPLPSGPTILPRMNDSPKPARPLIIAPTKLNTLLRAVALRTSPEFGRLLSLIAALAACSALIVVDYSGVASLNYHGDSRIVTAKEHALRTTGSARLDYVVEQIWGPGVKRGETRASISTEVPAGWELREQYWAVPNARSAQLLVPCNRQAAVRTLGDYAQLRPLKKRLARHALTSLAAAGVPLSRDRLQILAPERAPETTVAQIARQVGAARAFATFGVRTAANAKPTLELRDPKGDAIGFVKLAWNPVTAEAVENEATAMTTMGGSSRSAILAPRVLADGLVDGRRFVMTEPLPRGIRHVPATYSSLRPSEALGPGAVQRWAPIGDSGQVQLVLQGLRTTTSTTPPALSERAYNLAARVAAASTKVPIANFWHGDFVWWNTGRDPRGQLWLFDWETAQADAPAGMDSLHWYTHTADAENPDSVVTRVEAALAHTQPLLRSLGHSAASTSILAAWYAVTLVANEVRLAEALGDWERVKHSPALLEQILAWGSAQLSEGSGLR